MKSVITRRCDTTAIFSRWRQAIWRERIFQMVEYRIYEIGDGDHIVKATALACRDDHEALAMARELAAGRVVEVWNGERFVARVGAED